MTAHQLKGTRLELTRPNESARGRELETRLSKSTSCWGGELLGATNTKTMHRGHHNHTGTTETPKTPLGTTTLLPTIATDEN